MKSIRYRNVKGLTFSSISIIGLFLFYIAPFIISIYLFLFRNNTGSLDSLIVNTITSEAFLLALLNMLKFFCISLPLLFVLSFSLAIAMQYLMQCKVKGSSLLFALHMIPMIIPSAIIVYVIKVFFSRYGVVNAFLVSKERLPINWLTSDYSFVLLLLIYLWKNYGYCMIIFLGALESIEPMVLEAAKIDGAKGYSFFVKIILGQLKSFLRFFLIIAFIGVFKIFRESYLLFGSYPHKSVYMLQNYINNCITNLNMPTLITSAVILITMTALAIKLLLRGDKKNEE